ncbi:MAG: hypothetical protein J6S92_06005 [Oscillospiraceae bacterium]|nr:hypothetical protein [Oscillospiraceae bacterium]
MEAKTTAFTAVRQDVRLQEWSAQIEAQQAGGLSVQQHSKRSDVQYGTGFDRCHRAG